MEPEIEYFDEVEPDENPVHGSNAEEEMDSALEEAPDDD